MRRTGYWLLAALMPVLLVAQSPPAPAPQAPSKEPPVERVDEHRVRVDGILVDQQKGELEVEGFVNTATVLEYFANADGGFKAYESALELEASAVGFNLALILLGLEQENGVPSRFKFDPEPPEGDPVEVWVEWQAGGEARRMRAEDLIWDAETEKTLPEGPWVYTGSVFAPDGSYLADAHGVLIGFMHTPESIVDNPVDLESAYGAYRLRTDMGLEPGSRVKVIVKRTAAADEG